MLVQPGALIDALLAGEGISTIAAQAARLRRHGAQWQVLDAQGRQVAQAPVVVLANAADAPRLLADSGLLEPLPRLARMHALAGEVTLLPAEACPAGRAASSAARDTCCPPWTAGTWPAAPMCMAPRRR